MNLCIKMFMCYKTIRVAYLSKKSECFECKGVGDGGGKIVENRIPITRIKGKKIPTYRYLA